MGANAYIFRKSIIHRLNPSVKFISFILLIAMIFLPLGFFAQTIIGVIILIIFFLAKLPKKILWNVFKSVFMLFVILLIINWMTYKDPVAIYNIGDQAKIMLGSPNWINGPINFDLSHSFYTFENNSIVGEKYNLVSNVWGGEIKNYLSPNIIRELLETKTYNIDKFLNENSLTIKKLSNTFGGLNQQIVDNYNDLYGEAFLQTSKLQQVPLKHLSYYMSNNVWKIEGVKYQGLILSGVNDNLGLENTALFYTRSPFALSPVAIQLAIYISIKIFLMIVLSSILTSTTSSIELTNGLEDILSPFKILRLPVAEASMMIAIALRFIPSLLDESKRILNAQASRGVDFSNGGPNQKIKALISLVVPLFSIAFKKAEDLANAMEARSYNPRYARTRYRSFKLNLNDIVLFSIMCMIVGFLISLAVIKLYFTPFGVFEASALFIR